MGLLLWKKQKVSLLHSYHCKDVKKEDIPAYSRQMGIGIILIGLGICISGFLDLLNSKLWWLPISAGFITGFVVLHKTQMKYNGSWFSI